MNSQLLKARAFALGGVGALSLAAVGPASAAIDTTSALAAVADSQAFIVTVGLAVLTMIYVAKGLKWGRKAG